MTLKRILYFWLLAAVLCSGSTVVLTSCDDDDNDMEDLVNYLENRINAVNLIGIWQGTLINVSPSFPSDVKLMMDGKITFNEGGIYEDDQGNKGKWSLRKNALTLRYTEDGLSYCNLYLIREDYIRDEFVMDTQIILSGLGTYNCTFKMTRIKK